jgi:hypothetical protein
MIERLKAFQKEILNVRESVTDPKIWRRYDKVFKHLTNAVSALERAEAEENRYSASQAKRK